ncbi:DNA protecting protein DprA [Clostridiales bacterium oral taxon 876 str. F0540]|nr:DNA protecting protein DprA [Clostridiales bacterium oral taxon 876 str. F0540]
MIEHDIWFSTLKLSNKIKNNLIKYYKSSFNLWNEYSQGNLVSKELKNVLFNSWDDKKISIIKNVILENNIKIITCDNENFPNKLRLYDDSPCILYYYGSIEKLNSSINVSIVGSRKNSNYGTNVTKLISKELSFNNINIVSGLARGIDAHAHSTCIENGGFTCAVLGCGIDIVYPKENKFLFEEIKKRGVILSEFPPGTQPMPYNFPIRNRIISQLSDLIIIVEAGIKSGSLITANLALEQGIDVMAVPGSIFSEESKGCNKIIKDGAYPLTSIEDVFELLKISYMNSDIKCCKLSSIEMKINELISDSPIHIDDIIKITNIDINQLYEVLFELQLKNEIMCLAGNYYVKNYKAI